MIKENKLKYIISCIVILIPSLVGLIVKESVTGIYKGAWYFTWIFPLVLLALHTGLLILTRYVDHVKQSKKIENIIFFIIPAISFYVGSIFIAIMLGLKFNVGVVCSILMGVMFIVLGNYMPKAKRNRTFGIKIRWTLVNDDNWVATHRLAGKIFALAGIVMLLCAFLPVTVMFIVMTVMLVVIVAAPIIYSYRFYKAQIASGAASEQDYKYDEEDWQKKTKWIVLSIVGVVVAVCLLLGTGGLKFEFGDEALSVKPSLGGKMQITYAELADAEIEYREERVPGTRVMGYGSLKLLYGTFQNDEFGNYIRYTYTSSDVSIVIRTDEEVIVLAAQTTEETRAIYDELTSRVADHK